MFLHLLSSLYADDSLRFALWHVLNATDTAELVRTIIHLSGHVIFEDYSIGH